MVREIVTWCSPCFAEDVKADARTVAVVIDGGKPLTVDVCERHDKEIVQPLRELLEAHGSKLDAASAAPARAATVGRRLCPHCGASLKSADSLAKHIRRSHGDHDETPDQPTPPSVDESELAHACPDCERRFATPQGLGAHRSRLHGYVGPNNKSAQA